MWLQIAEGDRRELGVQIDWDLHGDVGFESQIPLHRVPTLTGGGRPGDRDDQEP